MDMAGNPHTRFRKKIIQRARVSCRAYGKADLAEKKTIEHEQFGTRRLLRVLRELFSRPWDLQQSLSIQHVSAPGREQMHALFQDPTGIR